MIANQAPGEIDWEVILENPIYDDPMDIDPHLDEWEDVFEEDLAPNGQTELQNIIMCVISFTFTCYCASLIVL